MEPRISNSNRWCVLEHVTRLDTDALREAILSENNVESGFTVLPVPSPVQDATVFKAITNGRHVLFGIALYNSTGFLSSRSGPAPEDATELLFDLRNDKCGFFQFIFTPPQRLAQTDDKAVHTAHRDRTVHAEVECIFHQPYPEYRQSDAFELQPLRHEWREETFSRCGIANLSVRWLFTRFRHRDLFAFSDVIGFNTARSRPCIDEFGSWNYAGGNGSADAAHFGHLYAKRPVGAFRVHSAKVAGTVLTLFGSGSSAQRMCLSGPTGEALPLSVKRNRGGWEGRANIPAGMCGRFRVHNTGNRVEPDYVAVDLPPPAKKRKQFALSVLYDSPMCIISNHHTPGRLRYEMGIWKRLGLDRVHVQNYSNWPSFWKQPVHQWHHNYAATAKACGCYFRAVIKAAKQAGLEAIGDHKVFDLGFNCWFVGPDGKSTVEGIESRHMPVIPELAEHQEWTLQANPEWLREPAFPIRTIRLYSESPVPNLRKSDVRIRVSPDNRSFRTYTGAFQFSVREMRRRHKRWTPGGTVPTGGSAKNWCVELTGLSIRTPYVAIQLGRDPWSLWHRGYMVAEAVGADGEAAACTVATNGSSREGFYFWKGWMGWSNHNEPLLDRRSFPGHDFGLVFREMPNMPTLLEPAFPGARDIWLGRLRHSLSCGVDGVAIRTYCHHNGMMQYLKYAFAAPVCDEFLSRYGRVPRLCEEDYIRIRRIRGEFYTEFMRAGSAEARKWGRKFICILESGVEVPAELDVRMHLPLEWRRWITEGLLDEIRLKYFTAESRFVHEDVLPLARKHGVRVTLTSRCLHTGIGLRGVELARQTIRNAIDAGFDGYCLYEQQNLMDMNPLGRATLKGRVSEWFAEARSEIASTRPRRT